jgi:uncharacterized protein (DUF1697 family)
VNVGGRKVTMKELKAAVEDLGYDNVRTFIASGNLVFDTKKTAAVRLEAAIEGVITSTFGLFSEVMVRNPDEWTTIIEANPFSKKAKDDPAHLVCTVCKTAPDAEAIDDWLQGFRAKYDKGEKLKVGGREIYIDYGDSIGQSKLILPKKLVSGTARNWNSILKLHAMLND